VFPDLTGVVVHDRYQNYDKFPGITHQLCCQHLLRDLADAAQSYPDAIWPGQTRLIETSGAASPISLRRSPPRPDGSFWCQAGSHDRGHQSWPAG
jgi:hypothetical protein